VAHPARQSARALDPGDVSLRPAWREPQKDSQDLFDEMYASLADRSTRKLLKRLSRLYVLALDEVSYLSFDEQVRRLTLRSHQPAVRTEIGDSHDQPAVQRMERSIPQRGLHRDAAGPSAAFSHRQDTLTFESLRYV